MILMNTVIHITLVTEITIAMTFAEIDICVLSSYPIVVNVLPIASTIY